MAGVTGTTIAKADTTGEAVTIGAMEETVAAVAAGTITTAEEEEDTIITTAMVVIKGGGRSREEAAAVDPRVDPTLTDTQEVTPFDLTCFFFLLLLCLSLH